MRKHDHHHIQEEERRVGRCEIDETGASMRPCAHFMQPSSAALLHAHQPPCSFPPSCQLHAQRIVFSPLSFCIVQDCFSRTLINDREFF